MTKRIDRLLLLCGIILPLSSCNLITPVEETITKLDVSELAYWQDAGEGAFFKSDIYEMHSTIAGYFTYGRPFVIENDNQNVHIYNNLCLYEGDEFFIAKNKTKNTGSSLPNFDFCFKLKEDKDEEYVTVDIDKNDPTCGSLFIKEGKDGEYKISFDVETKLIDIEFLREIDTPKYDYIKHCDISEIHYKRTSYQTLRENKDNPDELCVLNYDIPMHASIVLDNNLGSYTRVWLDESLFNLARTFTKRELIHFSVGGNYNVYLNRKDYSVRLELNNPENAKYNCFFRFTGGEHSGDPETMTQDQEHPYIFHLNNFSNETDNGYVKTIRFVEYEEDGSATFKYKLDSLNENIERNDNNNYSFTSGGTFNISINLLEGTILAEKLA
ncbi:MAG: hypothetical protein K5694_01515 [Bacilli bacterium]|nr:hypothetical protein [Bacilli bacterium]